LNLQTPVILRSGPLRAASRRAHRGSPAASQGRKGSKIAPDQRLLLFPPPAFYLALGCGRVIQSREILLEHQGYWSAKGRVPIERTSVMLG
jgi:hypothetical protein